VRRGRRRRGLATVGAGMVRLTTTQRGLGYDHQRTRRERMAQLRDGDPCPRCGGPMFRGQYLDLDDFPGRIFGGPGVKLLAAVTATAAPAASSVRRRNGGKRPVYRPDLHKLGT